MRNNQPVSQREYVYDDHVTLMTTTDLNSYITYANDAFVEASGFSSDEVKGQPHNMVRHPDMPPEAFADMWATLKQGEPWTALVKNRRKNGITTGCGRTRFRWCVMVRCRVICRCGRSHPHKT